MAVNYDEVSKRMVGAQADIAELMRQIMTMKSALTTPTVGPEGNLQGPMVEALMQAQNNSQMAQATNRLRLRATPFNPFGDQRAAQTFGPSTPVLPPPAPPSIG